LSEEAELDSEHWVVGRREMKKALRKVARAGKAPKVEEEYVDETDASETESEQETVEEQKGSQPWESIVKEKR
jgi:neutral trehalase